jgi:hypothetical protein
MRSGVEYVVKICLHSYAMYRSPDHFSHGGFSPRDVSISDFDFCDYHHPIVITCIRIIDSTHDGQVQDPTAARYVAGLNPCRTHLVSHPTTFCYTTWSKATPPQGILQAEQAHLIPLLPILSSPSPTLLAFLRLPLIPLLSIDNDTPGPPR